jgi:hypothetical protein
MSEFHKNRVILIPVEQLPIFLRALDKLSISVLVSFPAHHIQGSRTLIAMFKAITLKFKN